MLSVLTEDTLRSAQTAVTQGDFGLFDGEASTIFFEVWCSFCGFPHNSTVTPPCSNDEQQCTGHAVMTAC